MKSGNCYGNNMGGVVNNILGHILSVKVLWLFLVATQCVHLPFDSCIHFSYAQLPVLQVFQTITCTQGYIVNYIVLMYIPTSKLPV